MGACVCPVLAVATASLSGAYAAGILQLCCSVHYVGRQVGQLNLSLYCCGSIREPILRSETALRYVKGLE